MKNNMINANSEMTLEDLLKESDEQLRRHPEKGLAEVVRNLTQMKSGADRKTQIDLSVYEQAQEQIKHAEEVTSMDLPLDFENAFGSDARASEVHADSIPDGLVLSLANLGRVDIEYISAICGEDMKKVIQTLRGSIYQNPATWGECFYKGWETADEYLSGNLMQKYLLARDENKKYNGYFKENVKAIHAIIPPLMPTKDIYVTLGSPWVPTKYIDDFICHLMGVSSAGRAPYLAVKHDELTGSWDVPFKTRFNYTPRSYSTYGTRRLNALQIIERTLNMSAVVVYDMQKNPLLKSGEKRILNNVETALAQEKQKKIIAEFQQWIWLNPARAKELTRIYTSRYGRIKARKYDGSFLTFPTMSEAVQLYPYQKNAVARILFSPNTLLAHDVGSGKTYVMIAAAMELARMGLSKKNMFVVPNNIVGQWKSIFLQMYPNADLLVIEPKNFTPSKRDEVLERIRDEHFDAIIMAYSCFELIPLSLEYMLEELKRKIKAVEDSKNTKSKSTACIGRRAKKLEKAKDDLLKTTRKLRVHTFFDQLGITRLFVDEAHNFKNVPIETKTEFVLGISATGSQKCADMMEKVHCVQRQNNGGGVVFATGTPITNSITDAYIMQQYLQSGELAMLDLQSFDSWIGMFAETDTQFEIDVDTKQYRLATRFSKFHNLPELTSLLSSIADFHAVKSGGILPRFDGYSDVIVKKTAGFERYLKSISKRADLVRKGTVNRKDDNMLKITVDGRKAALDLRLADPRASLTNMYKVNYCAANVVKIYNITAPSRCTQLVFCDMSTPKAGFNVYDALKSLLVNAGKIPANEIAFIHSATTDAQRADLFEKVRNGDVRVLIGSTFKLGLGVNVQDRLIAVHHLDVPWKPADMVQREGRILRQGNLNLRVYIYRYITEGSFDAYSWQLLESKQRFISALLSGSIDGRDGSDIDDCVLNYAEVKALAIGDPLIKERVEVSNELSRNVALQHKLLENREILSGELGEIAVKKKEYSEKIKNCKKDIAFVAEENRRQAEYEEERKAEAEKAKRALKERQISIDDVAANGDPEADLSDEAVAPDSYDVIDGIADYEEEQRAARKALREDLFSAVFSHFYQSEERFYGTYRGFDIIIPANMREEEPFVNIVKNGRYYVVLKNTTENGILKRIDNLIDDLGKVLESFNQKLFECKAREAGINKELSSAENYADVIKRLESRLKEIDKKLGVNNG